MPYRIIESRHLCGELKRILNEQMQAALEDLEHFEEDSPGKVHDIRKRCKKCRAALRLIRGAIGGDAYQELNGLYRDAAHLLEDYRRGTVYMKLTRELCEEIQDEGAQRMLAAFEAALRAGHEQQYANLSAEGERMREVAAKLGAAQEKAASLAFADEFDAAAYGLGRNYKRGRRGFARAYRNPSAANFHEWRKRVKYLWYHVRMLRGMWPEVMQAWRSELNTLGKALGDHHDYCEYERMLRGTPEILTAEKDVETAAELLREKRAQIESEAQRTGARVFAEKKKEFVRRLERYYSCWQEEQ